MEVAGYDRLRLALIRGSQVRRTLLKSYLLGWNAPHCIKLLLAPIERSALLSGLNAT